MLNLLLNIILITVCCNIMPKNISEYNENQLTKVLLLEIFKLLDAKNLVAAARVNRTWYHLLKRDPLKSTRGAALSPLDNFAYTHICQRLHEEKIPLPPTLNPGNAVMVARHLHTVSSSTLSDFFTTRTQRRLARDTYRTTVQDHISTVAMFIQVIPMLIGIILTAIEGGLDLTAIIALIINKAKDIGLLVLALAVMTYLMIITRPMSMLEEANAIIKSITGGSVVQPASIQNPLCMQTIPIYHSAFFISARADVTSSTAASVDVSITDSKHNLTI